MLKFSNKTNKRSTNVECVNSEVRPNPKEQG